MSYFTAQELSSIKNSVKPQAPQKPKGRGGFLTSLISEGGGVLGGLAGIPLGPAGIAAGAALGSTLGRGVENKVRNDQNFFGKGGSAKDALTEGAISGVASAGPLKLLKAGKNLVKPAEEVAAGTVAKKPTGTFMKNLTTQGQQAQGRVTGTSAGSKVAGKELTPQDTERMLQTFKSEGIQTGNANNTLRDVKGKLDIHGKQISDHFKVHNAPLHEEDTRTIADNFVKGLKTTDPEVVKQASVLAADLQKNVKDTKSLWEFRKTLDSRIPDSKFADAATSNKIAAIKDMREYISKELGDIPGAKQYHDLSEIKPFVSAEARRLNNPGGGIVGRVLASGPAQKLESTAGKLAEKAGGIGSTAVGDAGQPGARNLAARILAGRGVDNATQLASPPEVAPETAPVGTEGQQAKAVTAQDVLDSQSAADNQDTDPYSPANIRTSIKNIIAQGGTQKDVDQFLSNAERVDKLSALGASSNKPISATAADAIANAQAGLTSLDQIEAELSKNPSVQGKEAITQTFNPFGITGKVTGTSNYDTAITQAKDVIARLRTGAAISNSEEARFTKMLPQPADPPETVQRKIQLLRNALTTVVQRVGGNSQDMIQEAAANQ